MSMEPPVASTMALTRGRPSPVDMPRDLVVKNGSMQCWRTSSVIPRPLSSTKTLMWRSLVRMRSVMRPSSFPESACMEF